MDTKILRPTPENIAICAKSIRSGEPVAFPTETVYGLGADIYDTAAVQEIFRVKGRPNDNPLIVHVHSLEQIQKVAREFPPLAEKLAAAFMPGALTLVLKKRADVPDCVTAGLDTVGVRMPSHAVCRAFLQACDVPVCAPSANTSTLPSPTAAMHVYNDLRGKIGYILDGGDCDIGLESTIVDVSGETPRLLRAGGIAREEIERVCGCAVQTVTNSKVALCPGMKYRHYAPRADVLFARLGDGMYRDICDRYDSLRSDGKSPVILCLDTHAEKYGTRSVYGMGADYAAYAHNLFAALRRADEYGYDAVLAEGVPADGIGAAIRNRLHKSSGGRTV